MWVQNIACGMLWSAARARAAGAEQGSCSKLIGLALLVGPKAFLFFRGGGVMFFSGQDRISTLWEETTWNKSRWCFCRALYDREAQITFGPKYLREVRFLQR